MDNMSSFWQQVSELLNDCFWVYEEILEFYLFLIYFYGSNDL